MMTTPKFYQRIGRFQEQVEAMQYDGNNGMHIENWTDKKAVQSPVLEPGPDNLTGAYMQLTNEVDGITKIVNIGCFVIKDERGYFESYGAKVFADMFVEITTEKAPPVGIMPRWLHDEHRAKALGAAIARYTEDSKSLPMEWIEEYNELIDKKRK